MNRPISLAVLFLSVIALEVGAQSRTPERPALGTWSFSPYLGGGMRSPSGYNWGTTPDRNHLMVGVHMATPVLRAGRFSLLYAPNATPFVMVSNNPRYRWVTTNGIARKVESSRGPVFGAGLAPFGLQAELKGTKVVDIYTMAALGGTWFSDMMPQDGAKRFNFSIEFGGGAYLFANRQRALQVGYKFLHMSNMYTARENPGLDGHVFYLGLRWQKRLPR
jgi:hypothetical protein